MQHPIFSTNQAHQLAIAEYGEKLRSQVYKNTFSFHPQALKMIGC